MPRHKDKHTDPTSTTHKSKPSRLFPKKNKKSASGHRSIKNKYQNAAKDIPPASCAPQQKKGANSNATKKKPYRKSVHTKPQGQPIHESRFGKAKPYGHTRQTNNGIKLEREQRKNRPAEKTGSKEIRLNKYTANSNATKKNPYRKSVYTKPQGQPIHESRSGKAKPYGHTRQTNNGIKLEREQRKNQPAEKTGSKEIRLNKYIANSGLGSRRQADDLIRKGLISVNKVVITEMGCKVKPGEIVRYEERVIRPEKPTYVLLNKPKGFITTTKDPQERKTVMSLLVRAGKERLYPIGRLDRSTTGLLLLTNDGALTNRLSHPSYKAKKIYKVVLNRALTKNDFQKIIKGVWLDEGKAIVDDLALVSEDKKTVGIELHIGWNRVVHRIFGALGYEVIKLDRTIYAGLSKKDLPRGKWRFLKPEEIIHLKHF